MGFILVNHGLSVMLGREGVGFIAFSLKVEKGWDLYPSIKAFMEKGRGLELYGMDMLGIDGNEIFMLFVEKSVFLFYLNEFFIQF